VVAAHVWLSKLKKDTVTMKAALIGENISGSLTPAMHQAEGKALGMDYQYLQFDTTGGEYAGNSLPDLIDLAEDQGFAGVNVTHPFKVQAVGLVTSLTETARSLGTINTIVFKNGQRIGHNTDYIGFRSSMQRDLAQFSIEKVLLLGAGGAGASVALALIDQGVRHLAVFDTDSDKTAALVDRLSRLRPTAMIEGRSGLDDQLLGSVKGVVNATPLGMAGHPGMAVDPTRLLPTTWIADIVYFPLKTPLLKHAKINGCPVVTGAGMALFQAVASFELFTGKKPDVERMRQFLDSALVSKEPVNV